VLVSRSQAPGPVPCRWAGTAFLESECAHALLIPAEMVGEFVA
jgi:hypothetical protein